MGPGCRHFPNPENGDKDKMASDLHCRWIIALMTTVEFPEQFIQRASCDSQKKLIDYKLEVKNRGAYTTLSSIGKAYGILRGD